MSDYSVTLTGKLSRFVGARKDIYYLGGAQVYFTTEEQAEATPTGVSMALSVNLELEVYPGDGYYVLT